MSSSWNRYSNIVKHESLHVPGLMSGLLAIHGGGMLMMQKTFLQGFDQMCKLLVELDAKVRDEWEMIIRFSLSTSPPLTADTYIVCLCVCMLNDILWQVEEEEKTKDDATPASTMSRVFFLVALVNDCINCKNRMYLQQMVFDGQVKSTEGIDFVLFSCLGGGGGGGADSLRSVVV
mgnify:CR=1 FL=1